MVWVAWLVPMISKRQLSLAYTPTLYGTIKCWRGCVIIIVCLGDKGGKGDGLAVPRREVFPSHIQEPLTLCWHGVVL